MKQPAAEQADGWQIVHVHEGAPAKPAFGAPCNGCGVCCLAEPCPLGMVVSGKRRGACDALRWDEAAHRYLCGMVVAPADVLRTQWPRMGRFIAPVAAPLLSRLARRWISAGSGCDASFEAGLPPR